MVQVVRLHQSMLTLTMILSETCATTVSGLESSSFVLAFNDTTMEKYLQVISTSLLTNNNYYDHGCIALHNEKLSYSHMTS